MKNIYIFGNTFLVEIEKNIARVLRLRKYAFAEDELANVNDVSKKDHFFELWKSFSYKKVWIDKTVLLQIDSSNYICVSTEILAFKTYASEQILKYFSPIDTALSVKKYAYPVAIGENNTYLLIDQTYIPNDNITIPKNYWNFYDDLNLKNAKRIPSIKCIHEEHYVCFLEKVNILQYGIIPFIVEFDTLNKEARVFYSKQYELWKSFSYKKVWIGAKEECEKGNSVLLQTNENKYIFIGDSIFEFKILARDKITDFYSPVSKESKGALPYAISKKNTYLMLGKKILPYIPKNDILTISDYFSNHKSSKDFLNVKILHTRI